MPSTTSNLTFCSNFMQVLQGNLVCTVNDPKLSKEQKLKNIMEYRRMFLSTASDYCKEIIQTLESQEPQNEQKESSV